MSTIQAPRGQSSGTHTHLEDFASRIFLLLLLLELSHSLISSQNQKIQQKKIASRHLLGKSHQSKIPLATPRMLRREGIERENLTSVRFDQLSLLASTYLVMVQLR